MFPTKALALDEELAKSGVDVFVHLYGTKKLPENKELQTLLLQNRFLPLWNALPLPGSPSLHPDVIRVVDGFITVCNNSRRRAAGTELRHLTSAAARYVLCLEKADKGDVDFEQDCYHQLFSCDKLPFTTKLAAFKLKHQHRVSEILQARRYGEPRTMSTTHYPSQSCHSMHTPFNTKQRWTYTKSVELRIPEVLFPPIGDFMFNVGDILYIGGTNHLYMCPTLYGLTVRGYLPTPPVCWVSCYHRHLPHIDSAPLVLLCYELETGKLLQYYTTTNASEAYFHHTDTTLFLILPFEDRVHLFDCQTGELTSSLTISKATIINYFVHLGNNDIGCVIGDVMHVWGHRFHKVHFMSGILKCTSILGRASAQPLFELQLLRLLLTYAFASPSSRLKRKRQEEVDT